jgi:hypothetical protein
MREELTMEQFAERLKSEQRRRAMVNALLREREQVERRLERAETQLRDTPRREKQTLDQVTSSCDYLRQRIASIGEALEREQYGVPDDVA